MKNMRYLFLRYVKRADGQIDEEMYLGTKIKQDDTQTANVILDFKDLKVIKASVDGTTIPKDWDVIVGYYYQFYPSIIERLFAENGRELVVVSDEEELAAKQAELADKAAGIEDGVLVEKTTDKPTVQ